MQIIMRVTSAGPAGVRMAGRSYAVPDAEGQVLIDGGYASLDLSVKPASKASAPAAAAKPAPTKDYVPAPEPEAEKEQPAKKKSR